MIFLPDEIKIKDRTFKFEVYEEDKLNWTQHHEIHEALNIAYGFRTDSFTTKTYSYRRPFLRILCRFEGKLVGHTALFEDFILTDKEPVKIAGVGLTLSLKPCSHLGFFLRQAAVQVLAQMDYPFAVGRVKSTLRVKNDLAPLVFCFLDLPLLGQSTRSYDWETLAIYKTKENDQVISSLIPFFQQQGFVRIAGEIF